MKILLLILAMTVSLNGAVSQYRDGCWRDVGGGCIDFDSSTTRKEGDRVWVYNTKTKRAITTVVVRGKKMGEYTIWISASDKAYLLDGGTKWRLRIKKIR